MRPARLGGNLLSFSWANEHNFSSHCIIPGDKHPGLSYCPLAKRGGKAFSVERVDASLAKVQVREDAETFRPQSGSNDAWRMHTLGNHKQT
jgi:hypothetical protein